MADNMSTFMRNELKYMMDDQQYKAFRKAINPYTSPDEYGRYPICNLYYDTDSFQIVRMSIEKPVYKEKLRVRSYGTPGAQDTVFLELKKKFKQEVFKRRVSMRMQDLCDYLEHGIRPDVPQQVMHEIEYFMSLYHLRPKVYIAYDRVALKGIGDESLRITFDENIRFRCDDLNLSSGDYGQMILGESQHLTEIKVLGAIPLWLCRALDEQKVYPTSFSKYGYCYQNCMMGSNIPVILPAARKNVA